MCKLLLATVGHAQVQVVADACSQPGSQGTSEASGITHAQHNHAVVLQNALPFIPNPNSECMTAYVAGRLGQFLGRLAIGVMPDINTIKSIQKIAWSSSAAALELVHTSNDDIHKAHEKVCMTIRHSHIS